MNFHFPTSLTWLNHSNATGAIQHEYLNRLLRSFPDDKIVALEIGCAYGGGVEATARLLGDRGVSYGFDTFEGHPKDLADDAWSKEATCMDYWYLPEIFGKEKLAAEYQRKVLEEQGLHNAFLVKGRVNAHSFDDVARVHFALMDLDLIRSTEIAYEALKDKFVQGAFFIMHDSLPHDHLPDIHKFVYDVMLKDGRWILEMESVEGLCTVMRRKDA